MQPPVFEITVVFAQEEANQVAGRATLRTAALDTLFSAIKSFSDTVRTNLGLIQRDDGEIKDAVVKVHTLGADVLALIASGAFVVRGPWTTATVYAVGDLVAQGGYIYLALEAHTAGTFATDLAALKWVQFTATGAAGNTSFASTGTIGASNVQDAIEEVDAELRVSTNCYQHQTFGGL